MIELKKIDEAVWLMEKHDFMKVPAYIYATEKMIEKIKQDRTLQQLKNVAGLEGIIKHALVMPDAHEGYGFPIGGVAAFDAEDGLVSPGGVGYDINCGVRLLTTQLHEKDVRPKIKELCDALFKNVPSGVGSEGRLKISHEELDTAVVQGVDWAIEKGYGWKEDKERCEEYGQLAGANPKSVTSTAKARGKSQLGTLGAGNHFLEVQTVEKIFNEEAAKAFGLYEGQITVMIHCGSRGYGHQICTDILAPLLELARKMNLWLPDKELVYAPLKTPEAQRYLDGMRCAVNYAFINRHIIAHWTRETFDQIFGNGTSDNMHLLYDVAHNIAKFEYHNVDGKRKKLIVHRKGATRAFPAGRDELPPIYRNIGQPVLIPGSMGTASYVLLGKQKGLEISWGTTCHGSGRTMSRAEAIRKHDGRTLVKQLWNNQGIYVRATEPKVVAEEAPDAYKSVDDVVEAVAKAGISDIVAKLRPIGVVKG
jgi:tRNA-splicing ligase RtcB